MKKDLRYDLPIASLSEKTHDFGFDLDKAFFEQFDQTLIPDGKLLADVKLDKNDRRMVLDIHIHGTVQLICDRSLDEFDQPIDVQHQLLVRYGDHTEELDDDVLQITPDTQVLPLAQHLFDYIGLALPMKKLHPRFQNEEDDNPDSEVKLIYSSGTATDDEDDDEDTSDPRWNALRNLN
ncbi:DUF177 domain-containing protein [Hymenobacter busanensis]|uniref:DUF177 domain-containing protein n=1 Tax=Hymenobacter busanensis TaxID=2607656 RepID=A0A7L4ZU42_9BACT|nr:DUF177 domain-containing protein [Hymenobacter busanensis]KAA9339577.1 DUF177 domain-containing protein [Hymenobacter busanensis]QHJ06668.1 DUF177 domain-containing protein [Hymenobacter busanensis]